MGIFRLRYPFISETFVTTQALALTNYYPLVLSRKKYFGAELQGVAVSDADPFGVRQAWLALTRSPSFFLKDARVRKLSLIHAHFGMDGVYALKLAERLSVPLVVTYHGVDATSSMSRLLSAFFGVTVFTYARCLHLLKKRGAAFIAVSDFIRDCLLSKGFSPEKVHRIYIGVDTARFTPLPKSSEKVAERYILNVARHVSVKGVGTTLRAFARVARDFPEVNLVQVGVGPLTESHRRLSRELGIADRVRFLGNLPHESVLHLMQRSEIVALTSETANTGAREALGMVLNEASSCGIPVVATRSGGIPEAVIDGETGFLSPERDDQSLAENLARLLVDNELRQRFGAGGRKFVCERFCLRKQTSKLELLYDQLVKRN